jgi:hypothetical protein
LPGDSLIRSVAQHREYFVEVLIQLLGSPLASGGLGETTEKFAPQMHRKLLDSGSLPFPKQLVGVLCKTIVQMPLIDKTTSKPHSGCESSLAHSFISSAGIPQTI